MNKEQQIRIIFLDEAQDCFDTIELVLLGLSSHIAEPQQLDLALRAAHSVKGGAAMMGFMALSKIAHDLEDFFKILRVRYHSTQISREVETLLLNSVDRLRQVTDLHRQDVKIEDSWLDEHVNSIFSALSQHLGEVQDEDENTLLTKTEDIDSNLSMLEQGIEKILEEFEQKLKNLATSDLAQELDIVSEKLVTLGRISDLEPFIQLCESIQSQANIVHEEHLPALTQQALRLWQRSHGLIVRGSLEKLPCQLEGFEVPKITNIAYNEATIELDDQVLDIISDFDEIEMLECLSEQELLELNEIAETEQELELDFELLEDADAAWQNEDFIEWENASSDENLTVNLDNTIISVPELTAKKQASKTIRVPVEQLYQFNGLFGKLILERNRMNLRLEQMKNFVTLMRQRMNKLERSNTQLRNWYEGGIIPMTETPLPNFANTNPTAIPRGLTPENYQGQFDGLEMDRYSDLHLISQEQIETIVQLQEVSTDIELSLQEMNQAVQELNQTTRSLQGNVTRTQMVPFAEVVKPFPRLIRDLCVQFDKQVNLKIEGERTLLDRAIIETLNAPLMHLIRNAFDHGIEDSATRLAYQKWSEGTITLKAVNRGTQTIITVSDDGGGINLEKVCACLKEMGVSNQQIRQMSESQILDYIFEPGFSTTDKVTELSGRGVGMDVVRTSIEEIRGDIHVKTKAGYGTTLTLKVPYTLSILRVMLVERAGMVFAIPADSIRQVFHLQSEEGSSTQKQITWQEEIIPLVRLEETLIFKRPRKLFKIADSPVIDKPTALIVGEENNLGAIQIDRFWSEQEVSIRPIDSPISLPQGFISSMVLGDGRVVPVIDPGQIMQACLANSQNQEQKTTALIEKKDNDMVAMERVDKILVVDDSINVRRYLAFTLEKAGYQVEQAKDGQEAVEKLMTGLSVQAVICDIEIPRLDGYGVLEEVKGKPEFQSLPIIMLTSRSNKKHRKLAMNLGASAYFSKPYNEQQLLEKLKELIIN